MKIATIVFSMTAIAQPIACNLNALTADERKEHAALSRRVAAAFREPSATADGWALSVPVELLPDLAKWIDSERKCCPFLRFSVVVEPGGTAARLTLSGREGVKEFLAEQFKLSRNP
ncbi:MAG: hypothetical protein FJW38_01170 [Acidobacteria bacterium]|nr:hypothetical protein [Acidobacteriota bacterium]